MDNNVIVKEKKGNNGYWIVIVILVFIIALLLGIILGQYIPNNKTNEENTTTNEVTDKENSTNDDSTIENTDKNTTEKTDEDIVKELFVSNLKNTYGENLIEYKINNIEIYTGNKRQEIANIIGDVADDDIITTVDYSIRLKDVSKDAGNGTLNGDWVLNKLACVQIGHDVTGYKILNIGTGW